MPSKSMSRSRNTIPAIKPFHGKISKFSNVSYICLRHEFWPSKSRTRPRITIFNVTAWQISKSTNVSYTFLANSSHFKYIQILNFWHSKVGKGHVVQFSRKQMSKCRNVSYTFLRSLFPFQRYTNFKFFTIKK